MASSAAPGGQMANEKPQNISRDGPPPSTTASSRTIFNPAQNGEYAPKIIRPDSHSIDIDDYFSGPMDLEHHSKWPMFMRLHGSVLPKMIVPLCFVAAWSTAITLIGELVHDIGVSSVLLTILGFVVGLSLSFRSTTAYERYNEGRKYWSQLSLTSRNLARLIWTHGIERHDDPENSELGKSDLLAKLTALNLINAFSVSLKHHLRFEPSADYPDLNPLINHLDTFASRADQAKLHPKKPNMLKSVGGYLGISFATSNPRKAVKSARDNLGNMPLEILNYLAAYTEDLFTNSLLKLPVHQTMALTHLNLLTDVLTGTERILNTPLPLAYNIAISQITWVYVLVLPFQLFNTLGWVTIPATVVAAYIIIGIATIGREIENPFGEDVNDLPLDDYCREIAADLDALTSAPAPKPGTWIENANNKVLYPLTMTAHDVWKTRSVEEIRDALRAKATTSSQSVMLERARTMFQSEALEV